MKSAMEKALDKIGSLDVKKLEEPKKDKSSKGPCCEIPYDNRPSIYLDEKELSTIGNFTVGKKVVLVVECSVRSVSTYDRMEGKETKKTMNCDLVVEAIADITKE